MLDFLLKNQPEFLKKFREYSQENFVFYKVVEDYIKEAGITTTPFSSKIPRKPHPSEEELQEIEKCDEGESRIVSRPANIEEKFPNQKAKNPQVRNINQETSWVRL